KTVRRERLGDALRLDGPDDGWLRMRDRRAGQETLRAIGELRSRRLFRQLGAYRCLVIDELREVASTAEEPWAEIAARLGGRWGLSLDGEMAALRAERELEPAVAIPDISADPAIDRTVLLADGRRVAVAE